MSEGGNSGGDAGDESSHAEDAAELERLQIELATKQLVISRKKQAKAKKDKDKAEQAKAAKAKAAKAKAAKAKAEQASAEAGVKGAGSGAKKNMAWWEDDRCVGKDQSTVRAGACGGCVRVRACLSCE
jgi:sRNA-binding protein